MIFINALGYTPEQINPNLWAADCNVRAAAMNAQARATAAGWLAQNYIPPVPPPARWTEGWREPQTEWDRIP